MGPREVVVKVWQVQLVRPKKFVELHVRVVSLGRQRGRVVRLLHLLRVLVIPVREHPVERLEISRVVAHTLVERVPRLVEILRAQALEVPQPVVVEACLGGSPWGSDK